MTTNNNGWTPKESGIYWHWNGDLKKLPKKYKVTRVRHAAKDPNRSRLAALQPKRRSK